MSEQGQGCSESTLADRIEIAVRVWGAAPEGALEEWLRPLVEEVRELEERCQDALDMSKGWCVWCEEIVPDAAAMKVHSAQCPSHPLRARIKKLEAALRDGRKYFGYIAAMIEGADDAHALRKSKEHAKNGIAALKDQGTGKRGGE